MAKKGGRPRKSIDRSHQFKICLWIALNKSTRQIIDLLRDRCGITMTEQNIDQNYRRGKRWIPVIEYLRTRYLRNISRIPIANKAHRLQILNEAVDEALTYHVKSKNEWGAIVEKRLGIIPSLINEARKEVEGDKAGGNDNSTHLTYITMAERMKEARARVNAIIGPTEK